MSDHNFTASTKHSWRQGVNLAAGGTAGIGRVSQTQLRRHCSMQRTGLFVGKAYTAMLDLKPGDEFTIVEQQTHCLIPVGGEEEGEE